MAELVVHPHLHPRRTGVTVHVEAQLRALHGDGRWYGNGALRPPGLVGCGPAEVLRLAAARRVVWHAHRNTELALGLLLRRLQPRLGVVFTRHSTGRPSWLTRWLGARADAVVTLTEEGARAWAGPSSVVPHGVDVEQLRPPVRGKAEAWRALGAGGELGLLVLGRLRPAKGQADVVEALEPLMASAPGWRLALVGRPDAPRWADGLRRPWVVMPGEQPDARPWLEGASVLVNASHREGFGLTTLEGMATGCCVVAAALPHVARLIRHGETGFIYPPGDVAALRAVLGALLERPALAAEVGQAARVAVEASHSIQLELEALRAVYASVAR